MAKAAECNTPLPSLDLPGWEDMLSAFWRVTDIVGAPDEAAHDIWRALIAGRARSLRRRPYNDGFRDEELARGFWRDVKLFSDFDTRGRETIGFRVAKSVDPRIVGPGYIFYLSEADVQALWPLAPSQTETESVDPFELAPTPTDGAFYTGGRPSAARHVKQEAARRISNNEVVPRYGGLTKLARELALWWEKERQSFKPPGPPTSVGSIENAIRDLWKRSLSET